jgi:hypothetical protein
MRQFYLTLALALIAIGSFIIGTIALWIYCHATSMNFIFQGINQGNNASECTAEGAVWSLIFLVPSFLFIHLPILFLLRSTFGGMRPAIVFILLPAAPYSLLAWFLLNWDFVWILGISSLVWGIGSQAILARYGRQNNSA